jgi:hypothetical protein
MLLETILISVFSLITLFLNQRFFLFNHLNFYYLLLPLLSFLPKTIIELPFWSYLIALIIPYLINLLIFFYNNQLTYQWSLIVNQNQSYLSTMMVPLIILGWFNLTNLKDFYSSFFGLVLLSGVYLVYPIFYRLSYGRNSTTWKKKIDFYFNYYVKEYHFWFLIDHFERIFLGIMGIYYLIDTDIAKYLMLGYSVIKIIDSLIFQKLRYNLTENYYLIYQKILYVISLIILIIDIILENTLDFSLPFYVYLINFVVHQILSLISLNYSKPLKVQEKMRLSLSLVDLSHLNPDSDS